MELPLPAMDRGGGYLTPGTISTSVDNPHSSLRHNLANHGNLPDFDDVQELLLYLTLLVIVLSWMMREIHIAFFTTGFFLQQPLLASRLSFFHPL